MLEFLGLLVGALHFGLAIFEAIESHLVTSPHAPDTFEPHSTPSHSPDTQVSIAVGLEGPHDKGIGLGGAVDLRLFNKFGSLIGKPSLDHKIGTGNSKYVIAYQHDKDHEGQQAEYALLTGNDDAVCIAWITAVWADGLANVVSGDWGKACGHEWHYSNLQLGYDANDEPYEPKCIWIDKNGAQLVTAFQINFQSLRPRRNRTIPALSSICNTPAFKSYNDPDHDSIVVEAKPNPEFNIRRTPSLQRVTGENKKSLSGRQVRPQEKAALISKDPRVIITSNKQHFASELCHSSTSWGPSVVSQTEGKFCDMQTRSLYSLCGWKGNDDVECFNQTTLSLVRTDTSKRAMAHSYPRFKPSQVIDWTKSS